MQEGIIEGQVDADGWTTKKGGMIQEEGIIEGRDVQKKTI